MCDSLSICHRSTKAGLRKVQSPPPLLPEFFALLGFDLFLLLSYAEAAVNPPMRVPQLFGQDVLIAIVGSGTFMVGLGASVFFKPKSWYIALGAGTIVKSTSLYALFKPAWGRGCLHDVGHSPTNSVHRHRNRIRAL
jgi:hypothetical protein